MMKTIFSLVVISLIIAGCGETPFPKPHGYPRLDLPEVGYESWESNCQFKFKKPTGANIQYSKKNSCWFNIDYPTLNAKVHCSYIPVNGH